MAAWLSAFAAAGFLWVVSTARADRPVDEASCSAVMTGERLDLELEGITEDGVPVATQVVAPDGGFFIASDGLVFLESLSAVLVDPEALDSPAELTLERGSVP